jgi:hypothetical protein
MTTVLIKTLNNNLDNELVLYGALIGVAGLIGYSLVSKLLVSKLLKKSYVEKSVQTDTIEDILDTPDQLTLENLENLNSIDTIAPSSPTLSETSSVETISPISSTLKDKFSLATRTSEVGTQTIAEPNPDNVGRFVDINNAEYIAAKVEQLNALDPFLATP